jgi:hypothetical protein
MGDVIDNAVTGSLQQKATGEVEFYKLLSKYASSSSKKDAESYLYDLDNARRPLIQALATVDVSTASISDTFSKYISLLSTMVSSPSSSSSALNTNADNDSNTGDIETGKTTTSTTAADSILRRSITFSWQDPNFSFPKTIAIADTRFELASITISIGIWKIRKSADLCFSKEGRLDTATAAEMCNLLKEAAGLFDYVDTKLTPMLGPGILEDCSSSILTALKCLCLADCQSIIALRAQAKGNDPNLISSLCHDALILYQETYEHLIISGSMYADKCLLVKYVMYRECEMKVRSHVYAGLSLWKSHDQPGKGLRHMEEAKKLCEKTLKKLAKDYKNESESECEAEGMSRVERRRRTDVHQSFCDALIQVVEKKAAEMRRENEAVHFQKVATELPSLPQPKRLAQLIAYSPPDTAKTTTSVVVGIESAFNAKVQDAGEGDGGDIKGYNNNDDNNGCGSCLCSTFRWLLFLVALPLLLIVSLVGMVVWLILLPLKLCCCPCGCALHLVADVVEYVIKAPLRMMLFASGKPCKSWRDGDGEEKKQGKRWLR